MNQELSRENKKMLEGSKSTSCVIVNDQKIVFIYVIARTPPHV